MAAAASTTTSQDLRTDGEFLIRLGKSLQQSNSAHELLSIKYNYKPTVKSVGDTRARLLSDGQGGRVRLDLENGQESYAYEGQDRQEEQTLALLANESGDGFTLELLSTSVVCNLIKAPWESNRETLASQYAILGGDPADTMEHMDMEGTAGDVEASEMQSEWDYRHFMTAVTPSVAAVHVESSKSNRQGSPRPVTAQTSQSQGIPISRPARKPVNPMMPKRKAKSRADARSQQNTPHEPRIEKGHVPHASNPRNRRTQKAAAQVDDIDMDYVSGGDSEGELTFDNVSPKMPKSSARAAFEHGRMPTSFRSAASTPNGRVESSANDAPQSRSRFEMDHVENETSTTSRWTDMEWTGKPEDDLQEDHDVEDLDIGSPARAQTQARSWYSRRSKPALQDTGRRRSSGIRGRDDDGDDDLEAGLAAALAGSDDDEPHQLAVAVQDEEEESEEE